MVLISHKLSLVFLLESFEEGSIDGVIFVGVSVLAFPTLRGHNWVHFVHRP